MLPSLSLLEKIPSQILKISNRQGEYKRKIHYDCYLLCQQAGLRVSEALNFDLSTKTKKGLYRITKTKGKKQRLVYIPQQVINELKKHDWQPNRTNRFNFYHFLRKVKRELGISRNIELTPHTLTLLIRNESKLKPT
jgi:integrase